MTGQSPVGCVFRVLHVGSTTLGDCFDYSGTRPHDREHAYPRSPQSHASQVTVSQHVLQKHHPLFSRMPRSFSYRAWQCKLRGRRGMHAGRRSRWPGKVSLVEVGPRDGLQNEVSTVRTAIKVGLIDRLSSAGCGTIEAASFVSPKWIPQMADGREVMSQITRASGVRYAALTPNVRGLEAALEAGVDEVAVFAAASEAFSRANINCSVQESLDRFSPVMERAQAVDLPVRGYVSCVLGCPYEGVVSPEDVVKVVHTLLNMGCYSVSLGDTIGAGTAGSTLALLDSLRGAGVGMDKLAAHFHDTYGQALANILVALEEGITVFDTSVSGLGGCPYAPGASGNVATEDVVHMLTGMGVDTGIDMELLLEASSYISEALGRSTQSAVARAMLAKRDPDRG